MLLKTIGKTFLSLLFNHILCVFVCKMLNVTLFHFQNPREMNGNLRQIKRFHRLKARMAVKLRGLLRKMTAHTVPQEQQHQSTIMLLFISFQGQKLQQPCPLKGCKGRVVNMARKYGQVHPGQVQPKDMKEKRKYGWVKQCLMCETKTLRLDLHFTRIQKIPKEKN